MAVLLGEGERAVVEVGLADGQRRIVAAERGPAADDPGEGPSAAGTRSQRLDLVLPHARRGVLVSATGEAMAEAEIVPGGQTSVAPSGWLRASLGGRGRSEWVRVESLRSGEPPARSQVGATAVALSPWSPSGRKLLVDLGDRAALLEAP